jgi:hypothetical protein
VSDARAKLAHFVRPRVPCHYLFASHSDLQAAVKKMWKASRSSPSSLVVGSFAPSGLFEDAI